MSGAGSSGVERIARRIAPAGDEVINGMDERADSEGFPSVGPVTGAWLRLLARAVDAERVFEFGSGYGYSAYWIAPALPDDGEIVLTDIDADELDDARENLAAGGFEARARFELGDAIDVVERYEGPFDLVLLDNEMNRYVEAFEAVREKVAIGGIIAADDVMETSSYAPADVVAFLEGDEGAADAASDAQARGIADYLERVRADEAFETSLLPIGDGIALSVRVE